MSRNWVVRLLALGLLLAIVGVIAFTYQKQPVRKDMPAGGFPTDAPTPGGLPSPPPAGASPNEGMGVLDKAR
jgi:hypothetical protein